MAFSSSHGQAGHHLSAISDGRDISNSSSNTEYSHEHPLHSTAYNGSGGHINDQSVLSLDSAKDEPSDDVLQAPEPTKAATSARPAIGSRLLSSLSSAQPAAAGLARKGCLLHARAKSLVWAPKVSTAGISASPERPQHQQQRNSIFADVVNGESAPVRIGIPPSSPTKAGGDFVMEYQPTFTERPRRGGTAQTHVSTTSPSTPPAKMGGWFSRRSTAPAPTPIPTPTNNTKDELLNLDFNAALFPTGPAHSQSPHCFNDLLLNATNLLQRMQKAYQEKVDHIASIQPEIDAQKEEVEEAETRSRHLKMQLEGMSYKADEQNKAMQEMALQLAEAKMEVQETREANKPARLVPRSTPQSRGGDDDDETTPRRGKRRSAASASDSGFESDAEYAESVMSFGGVETPLSPPTMIFTPACRPASTRSGSSYGANISNRPGSEAAAWATVEHLRSENAQLRRQMEQMQRNLQGCIDFVGHVNVR